MSQLGTTLKNSMKLGVLVRRDAIPLKSTLIQTTRIGQLDTRRDTLVFPFLLVRIVV